MNGQGKPAERERRDWAIILIILLFGFLCVILAGEQASRFSQTWKLDTNMRSNLDPDTDFLTNKPAYFYEPIDPAILTQQIRINNLLTPGALFEILPSIPGLNPPIGTPTPLPTLIFTPTVINPTNTPSGAIPTPTNTLIYFLPPPPKNTPKTPPKNTPLPSPTNTAIIPLPTADLAITKNDGGVTTVNPGDTITYTVRVTNNGPDSVTGAVLSDPAASGLSKTAVACSLTPGQQCATPPTIAELESGSFALPALNNGEFYEITITTDVTATSGSVTNIATVTAPAGFTDTTGNNTATDTNTVNLVADLSITKTDGDTDYVADAWKIYTIEVFNPSTFDITGATVTDIFSTNPNIDYSTVIWGCLDCVPILGGIGDINNQSVNIPANSSITFNVVLQAVSSPFGPLDNTATVTAPGGVTDAPGNNSATDTDQLILASPLPYGNIGTDKDSVNIEYIPSDTVVTITFTSPLNVGAHAGYDLVYYELPQAPNPGINMDAVILQVGDGSNWFTILNWGNGTSDTNTNISAPPGCAGEPDNCHINAPLLYNSTGVSIELDGVVPNGSYPYFRIISPPVPPDDGDGVEVDAIYIITP